MSLPEESVAVNTLPEVTTIPTGKKLIFTDPDTNEGGIITLENLTKQILQNLTSQTFTLDQGNLTLLQALNQLNSKSWNLTSDVTKIPQNADMNTYQTPGNYISEYNDLTTTLINCPVNEAFSLKIYAPTTGGYIIQEYTTFNGTQRILRSYSPYSKIWKCNEIAFK